MKTKMEDFEVLVPNMEGTEVEKKVTVQIPLAWDEEFGQWVLTPEAHQIIDDTKAVHMGLLLPAQLKELRQRLGFSQKQMGELFQVGEKKLDPLGISLTCPPSNQHTRPKGSRSD